MNGLPSPLQRQGRAAALAATISHDAPSEGQAQQPQAKRKPAPKRKAPTKTKARKPRVKRPASAAPAVPGEADPLADPRIRPLLERYCRLARVKQATLGADHHELNLPPSERRFFRDRESLRVAFSLDALERDRDAEIAILGSPFLSQLLDAIRARATRLSLGLIAPHRAPRATPNASS